MSKLVFDHIVLAVPHLQNAIDLFHTCLDVKAMAGGRHVGLGTHNAIVGLG